jgi:diacylglycerol kinase family enzyme
MRALLVVNPKATTTNEHGRELLVRALRSEVDLTVEYTRRRGHAAELAQQAVEERIDVVITLGGDGTVNEVVNGLLRDGPGEKVPALAVVPGGSANVFAGALGLPRSFPQGTGAVLDALHRRRARTIGLGRSEGRYFTFCAGFGLDAAVVRRVELARLRGRTSTPTLYVRNALRQVLRDAERGGIPPITLERPGEEPIEGLAMAVVQNTAPWTYIGGRWINPCLDASFDTGLDVMAMTAVSLPSTTRVLARLLARRGMDPDQTVVLHDLAEVTLRSARPLPLQLDGDYLGEREKVTFCAVPAALRVFC